MSRRQDQAMMKRKAAKKAENNNDHQSIRYPDCMNRRLYPDCPTENCQDKICPHWRKIEEKK